MGNFKQILYFDTPDRPNIDEMLKYALTRIDELGVKHIIMAWSSGYTVRKFLELNKSTGKELNVIVVTNARNAHMPIVIRDTDNEETRKRKEEQLAQGITGHFISITDETREELEKEGAKVYYVPDYLNVGEPLALIEETRHSREILAPFIVAKDLRPLDVDAGADLSLLTIISQGFRVSLGGVVLAARENLVPTGELVLTIAGMATALIVKANPDVKKCYVKEIIGYERGSGWDEREGP
jgi:hypothetical protein